MGEGGVEECTSSMRLAKITNGLADSRVVQLDLFRAIVAAGRKGGYLAKVCSKETGMGKEGRKKKDCDPAQFPRARCFNRARNGESWEFFFRTAEGGVGE